MALIKCKECNTEISDKATCCVNCGYPIEKATLIECSECKTHVNANDTICYNCGAPIVVKQGKEYEVIKEQPKTTNKKAKQERPIFFIIVVAIIILILVSFLGYFAYNKVFRNNDITESSNEDKVNNKVDSKPYFKVYNLLTYEGQTATIKFFDGDTCKTDFTALFKTITTSSGKLITTFNDEKPCNYEVSSDKELIITLKATFDVNSTIGGQFGYIYQNSSIVLTDNQQITIKFNDDYSSFEYLNGNWYAGSTPFRVYFSDKKQEDNSNSNSSNNNAKISSEIDLNNSTIKKVSKYLTLDGKNLNMEFELVDDYWYQIVKINGKDIKDKKVTGNKFIAFGDLIAVIRGCGCDDITSPYLSVIDQSGKEILNQKDLKYDDYFSKRDAKVSGDTITITVSRLGEGDATYWKCHYLTGKNYGFEVLTQANYSQYANKVGSIEYEIKNLGNQKISKLTKTKEIKISEIVSLQQCIDEEKQWNEMNGY